MLKNRSTHLSGRSNALRDWQQKDVANYVAWQSPEHRWHRLVGPYYPGPGREDLKNIEQHLQDEIRKGDWPEPRQRLVLADIATDTLRGVVTW